MIDDLMCLPFDFETLAQTSKVSECWNCYLKADGFLEVVCFFFLVDKYC
jgi:hypothetical protein